jgi:hypothetical protein
LIKIRSEENEKKKSRSKFWIKKKRNQIKKSNEEDEKIKDDHNTQCKR